MVYLKAGLLHYNPDMVSSKVILWVGSEPHIGVVSKQPLEVGVVTPLPKYIHVVLPGVVSPLLK